MSAGPMRDPIRDQLAAPDPRRDAEIAFARAQPSHEVGCSWGVGQRCTCKAIRAERGELSGPQPPAEDIRNALQILAHPKWMSTEDVVTIERLLRHALTQLEPK